MPGTTCAPLGLSLETTAGLLLCSGRTWGLHSSSSQAAVGGEGGISPGYPPGSHPVGAAVL